MVEYTPFLKQLLSFYGKNLNPHPPPPFFGKMSKTQTTPLTLYSKCGQASNLWQQLNSNLICETLRNGVGSGLLISMLEKLMFDWSNNTVAIDVKMDDLVLGEKSPFKMMGLSFSSKLVWGFYIISIAKTASKKIGALISSEVSISWICFVSLRYNPMWNTAVISGLVLIAASWNC